MTLSDYLKKNNITQEDFATRMDVEQQTVSDWCAGSPPKRLNAFKIVKITKGAVTLQDLWGVKMANV